MNKHSALPLLAFAAFSAFAAPRAAEEEFAFRPAAGQRLVFAADTDVELELAETSMVVTREGEEHEMDPEGVERTISHKEDIAFTDEIVEVAEGRITKLRRTFDEISQTGKDEQSSPGGEQSDDRNGSSELEGATVVFTWDADEEAYTAAFEGEEGDTELLDDLEGEVDFTEFLPEGPVSKDDTWTVDAKAFDKATTPSGDLHIVVEGEEPDEEGGMDDQLDENLEGEINCKLSDVRDEDGVRIAVIAITAKLTSHGAEEDSQEVEEIGAVAISRELAIAYELEGELLWNLTAGRASGFSLSGDVHYDSKEKQEVESLSASMQQALILEGTFSYTAHIE